MHSPEKENATETNSGTPPAAVAVANLPATDSPPDTKTKALASGTPLSWWLKTWGMVVVAGGVILTIVNVPGLFNSAVEEVENIPKSVEKVQQWLANDAHYRGSWTNDTDGIMESGLIGLNTRPSPPNIPPDQGRVSIELKVESGEVSGMISSRSIAERRIHTFMLLSGESSSEGIVFNVWDYFDGKPLVFAQLFGKWKNVDGEDRLLFRTLGQATDIFPDEFYVWRGGSLPPNPVNEELLLKALEIAACTEDESAEKESESKGEAACKADLQTPSSNPESSKVVTREDDSMAQTSRPSKSTPDRC